MKKKLLRALVKESYINNSLDEKKVMIITGQLTRHELKEYIHILNSAIKKRTIFVDMPSEDVENVQKIQRLFSDKKIVVRTNPNLLLGVRITDNDRVYDMTMKYILEQIHEKVTKL